MKPQIYGPLPLNHDPEIMRRVMALYRKAKAAGEFIATRTDPTGNELLIWMAPTPADVPVAFATFYEAKPKMIWLDLIWVAPEHRRQGLAKAMMLNINAISKRMKMTDIEFGTVLDNDGMRAAGKLLGYTENVIVFGRRL